MVAAERRQVDERVHKIIELKNKVLTSNDFIWAMCLWCSWGRYTWLYWNILSVHMQVCSGNDKNFIVINQKGIDPPSLDLLARAGVSYGLLTMSWINGFPCKRIICYFRYLFWPYPYFVCTFLIYCADNCP